jgi:hypothetical protein
MLANIVATGAHLLLPAENDRKTPMSAPTVSALGVGALSSSA